MITEDYVSFETAKFLKEKGFNEPCRSNYRSKYSFDKRPFFHNSPKDFNGKEYEGLNSEWYSAPTLQMAMKWLREEKGIAVIPIISSVLDFEKFLWDVKIVVAKTHDSYSQGWVYEKQESACEAAIKYCLENLI
jgi:hypothetical protein